MDEDKQVEFVKHDFRNYVLIDRPAKGVETYMAEHHPEVYAVTAYDLGLNQRDDNKPVALINRNRFMIERPSFGFAGEADFIKRMKNDREATQSQCLIEIAGFLDKAQLENQSRATFDVIHAAPESNFIKNTVTFSIAGHTVLQSLERFASMMVMKPTTYLGDLTNDYGLNQIFDEQDLEDLNKQVIKELKEEALDLLEEKHPGLSRERLVVEEKDFIDEYVSKRLENRKELGITETLINMAETVLDAVSPTGLMKMLDLDLPIDKLLTEEITRLYREERHMTGPGKAQETKTKEPERETPTNGLELSLELSRRQTA